MLTSEARIATDRASRYLTQLCRHAGQMSRGLRHRPGAHGGDVPPRVEHAQGSDTDGIIKFAFGQCALQATQDTLTLRAEAADEDGLRRIQEGITRRLETIGRRDQLTVTWQQDSPGDGADNTPAHPAQAAPRPRRVMIIGLIAAGLLIVAVHVGLFGGAVTSSPWTKWGVNAILALVLVKVVLIGSHVVLGRLAIRRRKRRMTPSEP